MSSVNAVTAKDPTTGIAQTFTDGIQLATAIQNNGFIPIRADGSPYKVQIFMGGYLLDGMPLNVLIDGFWYAGQVADLTPYWQSGQIPTPPAAVLAYPTQAMPSDLAAATAAAVSAENDILGMPWYVWAGVAAAYFLL